MSSLSSVWSTAMEGVQAGGALASIVAAGFAGIAWTQSRKQATRARVSEDAAGKSREAAERAREEVMAHQRGSAKGELRSELRSARSVVAKYGPGSSERAAGANTAEDAQRVQSLLERINELAPECRESDGFMQTLGRVPDHLKMLACSRRKDETERAGSMLYRDIEELLGQLDPILPERSE